MAVAWKPDYITLAQLKGFLRIKDTDDDAELSTAITAASRAIDLACHRQFGSAAGTRTYVPVLDRHMAGGQWGSPNIGQWGGMTGRWRCTIDDLPAAAGLTVTIGGVAVTKYTLVEQNAEADGRPYTWLYFGQDAEARPDLRDPLVSITAPAWGWASVPVPVVHACKIQAGRLHKRRDALFGVAGSPADGSELRLLAKVDPDVYVILQDFVRYA